MHSELGLVRSTTRRVAVSQLCAAGTRAQLRRDGGLVSMALRGIRQWVALRLFFLLGALPGPSCVFRNSGMPSIPTGHCFSFHRTHRGQCLSAEDQRPSSPTANSGAFTKPSPDNRVAKLRSWVHKSHAGYFCLAVCCHLHPESRRTTS